VSILFDAIKIQDEALLIYSSVFSYCGMYKKGTAQWGGPKKSLEKKSCWWEKILSSDFEILKQIWKNQKTAKK